MGKRKVLHIGNILNNAYITCKFLRRAGFQADTLNLDYKHVQGQPEWEDVYLNDPVPESGVDWRKVDLGAYKRPRWFYDCFSEELPHLCAMLNAGNSAIDTKTENLLQETSTIKPRLDSLLVRGARIARRTGGAALIERLKRVYLKHNKIYNQWAEEAFDALSQSFRSKYPDQQFAVTKRDVYEYIRPSLSYKPILQLYPLIQAYSITPLYVLLGNPGQPFVCFEHGTMREFPFENSARGRLYSLSLKMAERVIITNADCNQAAEQLGLSNYTFIPHPVDEELYKPEATALRENLINEHGARFIFVAPARHHWKSCPPGLENSWFKRNDILIRALGKLFHEHKDINAIVIFFEWGQEVAYSKQLIAQCGFTERVRWEPIRSKPVMKDFYNAADIIFDQFNDGIGTFGTVVPEALACAKPVILNYKKDLHTWCYPELPPLLHASSEEGIIFHILELCRNDYYRMKLGVRGRDWFMNYHSSKVVINRTLDIYRDICSKFRWEWAI